MAATGRMHPLMIAAAALCVVGAVDSAIDRAWDQLVLFGATMLLITAAGTIRSAHRHPLTLREDLADWLHSRSQVTGEAVETLADRAVAAHRAGLTGAEDPR